MLNAFWKGTTERAVKSAAQSALLAVGADQANVLSLDWKNLLGFAAGGALLSGLTSLLSFKIGPEGSPSVVDETPEA